MFKALAISLCLLLVQPVHAQGTAYPSKPVRVIIPYAAGSGSDVSTRIVVDEVARRSGATLVVDNKPGANGLIGVDLGLKAPADGYTLLMTAVNIHLSRNLFKAAKFDAVKDFSHVTIMTGARFLLAVPADSRYRNVQELVADAKANPQKLAGAYAATAVQIVLSKFVKDAGINVILTPYKSSVEALSDLVGGRVAFQIVDVGTAGPLMKAGKIRALLTMNQTRSPLLPDVPSLKDAGLPAFDVVGWTGMGGPPGLPPDAKQWLQRQFKAALAEPQVVQKLATLGIEPLGNEEPESFIAEQRRVWGDAAEQAGIQPQ